MGTVTLWQLTKLPSVSPSPWKELIAPKVEETYSLPCIDTTKFFPKEMALFLIGSGTQLSGNTKFSKTKIQHFFSPPASDIGNYK